MSTTVDSRVVEMRFDNKQFESNVQTSMSTLDKLKQKLNLSGASKGLDGLNTAAKNVDMNSSLESAGTYKFCPNCGTPANGAKFCSNCGTKLS